MLLYERAKLCVCDCEPDFSIAPSSPLELERYINFYCFQSLIKKIPQISNQQILPECSYT